jgi:hypothetical protein
MKEVIEIPTKMAFSNGVIKEAEYFKVGLDVVVNKVRRLFWVKKDIEN